MSLRPHLERNLAQAEALGQQDRAKALKKRLGELDKAPKQVEAAPYEDWTVEELKAEVSARELEGRSDLTTKADLVEALTKDDK